MLEFGDGTDYGDKYPEWHVASDIYLHLQIPIQSISSLLLNSI